MTTRLRPVPGHEQKPPVTHPPRRDKRGRRIGYNWWRVYITEIVNDHNHHVAALREDNHQMEPDEFSEAHPLLTLKACLIGHAGMNHEPEAEPEAA